jgi:hypothetical protein
MEDSILLHHTWSIHSISPFSSPLSALQLEKLSSHVVYPNTEADNGGSNYVNIVWMASNDKETDTSRIGDEQERHLRIEMFLSESWSCEIVLCFVSLLGEENSSTDIISAVRSFSMCLARGSKSSYTAVFDWLEKQTACRLVPCHFTSSELAAATASWTRLAYQRNYFPREQESSSSESLKPLAVTFQVTTPAAVADLDTITLTIPPVALSSFCVAMEQSRPHAKRSRRRGGEDLSVLRALQCFVLEAFSMDISSFQLIKASTQAASLGCDGRIKPQDGILLSTVLQTIRSTVMQRYVTNASMDVPDDDDDDDSDEPTALVRRRRLDMETRA